MFFLLLTSGIVAIYVRYLVGIPFGLRYIML